MFNLNGAFADTSSGIDALDDQRNTNIIKLLRTLHADFKYILPYVRINFILACVLTGVVVCVTTVFIA